MRLDTPGDDYPEIALIIGGERRTRPGKPVLNPATGLPAGEVPQATAADLADAVAAAEAAFADWSAMGPAARAEILTEAARLIRARADTIARTVTIEEGKTLAEAKTEILRSCDILDWDAAEGRRLYGRVIPAEPGMRRIVTREPVGPVAAFTPWNFPISSPVRKIAGALSAGCTMVLKPSEETPGGVMMVVEALAEAGLPAGVLNLVYGDPRMISGYLVSHPAIRMIAFTGSTGVGKSLTALAATHMKPALMELGGHAPVIICREAEVEEAARASVLAKSRNAGQVCVAPTRFFVEAPVYDRFLAAFTAEAGALKVGDGLVPGIQMGPLANARRRLAVDELVADARNGGTEILTGGAPTQGDGFFYPLTVVASPDPQGRLMTEEPFGPVGLVSPVADVTEAIARANALPYGLAGYAFAGSARNVDAISRGLACGNIAINHFSPSVAETPFGGIRESGFGREGGIEGLEAYTTVKTVSHLVL